MTSLKRRPLACDAEVRLKSRLSPEVYRLMEPDIDRIARWVAQFHGAARCEDQT